MESHFLHQALFEEFARKIAAAWLFQQKPQPAGDSIQAFSLAFSYEIGLLVEEPDVVPTDLS
jgi:hypothetical protein